MKLILVLWLVLACQAERSELKFEESGQVTPEVADSFSFQRVNEEVLVPKCLSCHSPGAHAGNIPLATEEDLLHSLVIPGDPENSLFYTITTPGAENMMPPIGEAALTKNQRELIKQWILKLAQ